MANTSVAGVALVVGLALVLSAGLLFPGGGERSCHTASASLGEGDATTVQYESLSPEGRSVVDAVLESRDGERTVHGDACPADFAYAGDQATTYRVVEGNVSYVIETSGSGAPAFPAHMLGRWALGLAGAALVVAAVAPGVPTGALVAALVVGVLASLVPFGGNPAFAVWVGGLFLATAVAAGMAEGPDPLTVTVASLLFVGTTFAAVDGIPPVGTWHAVPYATAALLALVVGGVRVLRRRVLAGGPDALDGPEEP